MVTEGHYWSGADFTVHDLDHLHESARSVARLPAQERVRHVRADRWIGYSRATEALERLGQSLGVDVMVYPADGLQACAEIGVE